MAGLEVLWLELTNRCNLACGHCYAESGPTTGDQDTLDVDDYRRLLDEGFEAGCRRVQFIGGEPTLFPGLSALIGHARKTGFSTVEVFTNLFRLSEAHVECFRDHRVLVGTSIYGATAEMHERITLRKGSFARTVRNISRLLEVGVHVRAGFIETELNVGAFAATDLFLKRLGPIEVGFDRVRGFGRGRSGGDPSLESLCGACAGNTLSVDSSGRASPCIMSRDWSFASVQGNNLSDLLASEQLARLRAEIETATRRNPVLETSTIPCRPGAGCSPDSSCGPTCWPQAPDIGVRPGRLAPSGAG